ncbi:MAG: hypothetical protein CM1200mP8_5520 [Chloroflexota bacterium]|nr:MAG: hypothetical protein CM1200mP8_5520 [Chloroflexota bacterium]
MSGMDPKVRERTDALDSLGNTTAATGKRVCDRVSSTNITGFAQQHMQQ